MNPVNPVNPDDESDVEKTLLEFLNEMPIDTFLALEVSTREQRRHMAIIEALARNYHGNGAPYGETMGDLRRWISERASNEDEIADVDRETDRADDEAMDRAAYEGMVDREEERMKADPDDSEDK